MSIAAPIQAGTNQSAGDLDNRHFWSKESAIVHIPDDGHNAFLGWIGILHGRQ